MLSANWSRRFEADMTMSAESIVPRELLEVRAPVFQGLQVIVSLNGKLRGGVNGRAPFDIDGSGAYLVLATGEHEGYDRFEAGTLQRFVKVGLDAHSAQRHGFDLDDLARSGGTQLCGSDVLVLRQPLTPALRAIATQILACPFQGTLRDVYLAGKGLELTATAMERTLAGAGKPQGCLAGFDVDRLWHARELATLRYQDPPTLHALAREVGINVKKLTAGFRQLFGLSVFEYVQQLRLQEAYRMLSTGSYSVSEVATFVGYTIPHFSTLFRKRFGMSPSVLTA